MAKKISSGWVMRFRLGWSHMNWPNCNRHIGSQGMVRTRQPGGLCILGCWRDGLIQAPAETGNEVHVDRGAGHPIQEVKGGHHQEDPGRRRNFWHITSHLLGHRFLRPGGIILSTAKDLWMPRKKSHMLPRRMWLLGKRVLAIRGTYQNWLYFKRDCCTTLEEFSYHALTLTLPFCLQMSHCANNWTFVDTQYSMMAGQPI